MLGRDQKEPLLCSHPFRLSAALTCRIDSLLAPLTNSQSHEDGVLSDAEHRWLSMRAEGGFGLTMTCAAHVIDWGKGFPGQLGCFSDAQNKGLRRLLNPSTKQARSLAFSYTTGASVAQKRSLVALPSVR